MTVQRPTIALVGAVLAPLARSDARAALDDADRCVLRLAENTAAVAAAQAERTGRASATAGRTRRFASPPPRRAPSRRSSPAPPPT